MVWTNAGGVKRTQGLLADVIASCAAGIHSLACFPEGCADAPPSISEEGVLFLAGEQALFGGRLQESLDLFLDARESALRSQNHEISWRSCFGAARSYLALDQPRMSRFFYQRGRTTYFSAVGGGSEIHLPAEVLLSVLREQVDSPQMTSSSEVLLSQLQGVRIDAELPDLRGEVEEILSQLDSPERRVFWLRESLNSRLEAGNAYAAMQAAEQCALWSLREREWESGLVLVEQAEKLADALRLEAIARRFERQAARLRHVLQGIGRGAAGSGRAFRNIDSFSLWN